MLDVKKWPDIYSITLFFRQEVVGDVNMPQAGQRQETVIGCGEQEPCVEGSFQVS